MLNFVTVFGNLSVNFLVNCYLKSIDVYFLNKVFRNIIQCVSGILVVGFAMRYFWLSFRSCCTFVKCVIKYLNNRPNHITKKEQIRQFLAKIFWHKYRNKKHLSCLLSLKKNIGNKYQKLSWRSDNST